LTRTLFNTEILQSS